LKSFCVPLIGVTGSWRDLQPHGRPLFLARSRHSAPQHPLAPQRPRLSPRGGAFFFEPSDRGRVYVAADWERSYRSVERETRC